MSPSLHDRRQRLPAWVRPQRMGLAVGGLAVTDASATVAAAGLPGAETGLAAASLPAWGLGVVAALVLVIAGLILSNRRLRRAHRTEREARNQAEQAVAARSRFLGYLSHELRGTVGALSAGAQMLHEGRSDPELHAQLLDGMRHAGGQLMQLLESTLQHERAFSDGLQLHPAALVLTDWWQTHLLPLQLAARAKGLRLRDTPPQASTLLLDGPRLAQVLNNLVHNAIKFTPQGEIHVSADWNGQRLLLRVADQGPGIALAEQALVFQPYQQGAAASRQRQGAGLGLAICSQIVTAMGGRLWLDSPPGSSCVFSVELPATGTAHGSASAPVTRPGPLELAA